MSEQPSWQEAQVARFCRQYLQLEAVLDFPDGDVLREESTQETLYEKLFAENAIAQPPPPRYQLKVLKELIGRIERSIDDWDMHVSHNNNRERYPRIGILIMAVTGHLGQLDGDTLCPHVHAHAV